MEVRVRQRIEQRIVMKVVSDLLAAGYAINVNDGEETTLRNSTDKLAIRGALFTTDEDRIFAMKNKQPVGWVYCVYGNDGWDVINDYHMDLEPLMVNANALAAEYEQEIYNESPDSL